MFVFQKSLRWSAKTDVRESKELAKMFGVFRNLRHFGASGRGFLFLCGETLTHRVELAKEVKSAALLIDLVDTFSEGARINLAGFARVDCGVGAVDESLVIG